MECLRRLVRGERAGESPGDQPLACLAHAPAQVHVAGEATQRLFESLRAVRLQARHLMLDDVEIEADGARTTTARPAA